MIYDCFSFFNELDLLEIRLNTLDKVVDWFILVESSYTHSGNPKPLYYAEHKSRFEKFNDRIIHIVADDFPNVPNTTPREMAWIRENWQRNAILRGLPKDVKDDDYLIIADLDEIPNPKAVEKATLYDGLSHLYLSFYSFFLNYKNYSNPVWCGGPQIMPYKLLHNPKPSENMLIYPIDWRVNNGMTPSVIRFLKPNHVIKNAGWHFSYCGGMETVISKLKAYAHTEFATDKNTNLENIKKFITSGNVPFINHNTFFAVSLDSSFPTFITENATIYANLIFPVNTQYKLKTFLQKIRVISERYAIATLRPLLPRRTKDWLYHKFVMK